MLPLVANVGEGKDSALLKPCDVGAKVDIVMHGAPDEPFPVHPCLLVATNGGAKDSYSVLASFGGKFTAANADGKPEAQAGVAQYFATGVAAQLLALKGGAAVVAVSDAATDAATTPVDQSAVRALFGGKPQPYSASLITGRAFPMFQASLLAKISAGSDATVGLSLKAFEEESKIGTNVYLGCTSKILCMTNAGNDTFLDIYHDHAGDMEDALKKWK